MKYTADLHFWFVILIMIIAGWFGGYLNYLHNFDTVQGDDEKKESPQRVRTKYILSGICASFLVPVFLKMIASKLISSKKNTDYLIFAGFCLVASIFSRRFIVSIGDKLLKELDKTKDKVDNVEQKLEENDQVVDALISNATSDSQVSFEGIRKAIDSNYKVKDLIFQDSDAKAVFKALKKADHTFRSISGLANTSGIDVIRVRDALKKLEQENLILEVITKPGRMWYTLSELGKNTLEKVDS